MELFLCFVCILEILPISRPKHRHPPLTRLQSWRKDNHFIRVFDNITQKSHDSNKKRGINCLMTVYISGIC